jgi:glutathione S-transferase
VLDYLEGQVPTDGFLFGDIGLADISIASFFRNAAFARFTIDAARWPRTAAYVSRALAHPSFAGLLPFEEAQIRTTPAGRREALMAAGAPLSAVTCGTSVPKPGVIPI